MSDDEKIVENLKEIKIVTNEEIIEILKKHGDEIPFVVGMKDWFNKECGDVSENFVYRIMVRDLLKNDLIDLLKSYKFL